MQFAFSTHKRGFTLIELIVVIAIIGILSVIILTTLVSARKEARDKHRISDLQQLQLGFRLYKEADGSYPTHAKEFIGEGGSIDTELSPFIPYINADPLNGDSAYRYWYTSSFTCTGGARLAVVAQKMENSKNSNYTEISSICGSNIGGAGSYVLLLN